MEREGAAKNLKLELIARGKPLKGRQQKWINP